MTKKVTILFFITILFMLPAKVKANELAFSVKANIPDNQRDKNKTYFDLRMVPNQEQDISINLSNSSDKEITLIVEPNNASTNSNGVIAYNQKKEKPDDSLKYPLTSLISQKQEVTLKPNKVQEVTFKLKMPKEPFDGIILGGFYIYKKDDENAENKQKNVQIENKFAYVIGIRLSQNDQPIKENLNLLQATPGLRNYHTVIYTKIQNDQPRIINDLNIHATITKKEQSKVLYEQKQEELSMAPNSTFNFPINLENQAIKPGKYTAKVTMKTRASQWTKETDFTIAAKEAKKINKEAVDLIDKTPNWIIAVIAFMAIIILLLIITLIRKRKV